MHVGPHEAPVRHDLLVRERLDDVFEHAAVRGAWWLLLAAVRVSQLRQRHVMRRCKQRWLQLEQCFWNMLE